MPTIDYSAPADLYPARNRFRKSPLGYMRFDTAAEAVRYAIEELPPAQLGGTVIEVDEARFESAAISQLYRSSDYPLSRAAVAS
ncbi:MAG: hypothetical protein ABI398_02095 [Devosia sp.]